MRLDEASIDWIAFAGVICTAIGLVWQHFWTRSELKRAQRRDLHEKTVQIPLQKFLNEILLFEYETYRIEDNVEGADLLRLVRIGRKLVREGSIALQSARQSEGDLWDSVGLAKVESLILEMKSESKMQKQTIAMVREEARWLYAAINGQLFRSMKNSG